MRLRVALCACLAVVLSNATWTFQQATADSPSAAAKSTADSPKTVKSDQGAEESKSKDQGDRRKALPTHFGSLGVTDAQRAELQVVQDDYEVKLQKLREELKQLTKERDQKLEKFLTEGQRLRLKELRSAAHPKEAKKTGDAKSEK